MKPESGISGPEYPHYRHNLPAFVGDYIFFRVGMAFIDSTTVLPSLVRELTASASLVGLVSGVSGGLWMLPQLVAANYMTGKPRRKPYMLIPASIGRPVTWLLALLLFLGLHPVLLYGAVVLWVAVFWVCDGLASVAWFDLVSSTIPPQRRGRLFGLGHALGGLVAVGAGLIVRHVLSQQGPPFPINYAWLCLLAGAAFLVSLGLLSTIREDPAPTRSDRLLWRSYLPRLMAVLGGDADFRLVTLVRLLLGAGGMSAPFYILYATEELGLPQEAIGVFVSVQVGASVLLGLLMGYLSDRAGSKRVIQLATMMGLVAPLGALLIPRLILTRDTAFHCAYGLVFVGLQGVMSAMMPGFINFVIDIAPREERPTYVGLANTLGAVLMFYPLLGGLLLERISYSGLFTITALTISLAFLVAATLRGSRRAQSTEPSAAKTGCTAEG